MSTSRPMFYDDVTSGTVVVNSAQAYGDTIEWGALEPIMWTMGVDSDGCSVALTETNLWKGGKRPCEAKFISK